MFFFSFHMNNTPGAVWVSCAIVCTTIQKFLLSYVQCGWQHVRPSDGKQLFTVIMRRVAHVWSSVMGSGRYSADNPELPKVSALKCGVDQNIILPSLVPDILSLWYLLFHFIQRYLFPSPLLSKCDMCVVNGERCDMRVMNGERGNTLVMNREWGDIHLRSRGRDWFDEFVSPFMIFSELALSIK